MLLERRVADHQPRLKQRRQLERRGGAALDELPLDADHLDVVGVAQRREARRARHQLRTQQRHLPLALAPLRRQPLAPLPLGALALALELVALAALARLRALGDRRDPVVRLEHRRQRRLRPLVDQVGDALGQPVDVARAPRVERQALVDAERAAAVALLARGGGGVAQPRGARARAERGARARPERRAVVGCQVDDQLVDPLAHLDALLLQRAQHARRGEELARGERVGRRPQALALGVLVGAAHLDQQPLLGERRRRVAPPRRRRRVRERRRGRRVARPRRVDGASALQQAHVRHRASKSLTHN